MLVVAIYFGALVAFAYLLWFVVLVWLVSLLLTVYVLYRQKPLSSANDVSVKVDHAPLVSVLVPARNEENRVLLESIRSILAQDYGRFEVIAVDDRSTDATYEILKSVAKTDARLQVIEGEELPPGWLGKPYAMHQAFRIARGEWILATDADMIFDKSAVRTAVGRAHARKADALTLIPHFETGSFWERVMIPAWGWVMLMFTVSYRINDPKTQGALGIGGFFLMRRTALERIGGYAALKDEVLEDVRLAEMIKRSGGSLLAEYAPGLLSTRMYRTFGEMWESCTKSWFAGMKFSLSFAILCVLWMYLIAVIPALVSLTSAIMIATGADVDYWRIFLPAVLSWLLQVVVLMMINFRCGISPAYAFTAPLALGLLYAMLLDSSIRITIGKGVKWKGRRIYERAGVNPPHLRAVASPVSKSKR
jgi:chlorobactene glucosyltransferase